MKTNYIMLNYLKDLLQVTKLYYLFIHLYLNII